MSQASNQANDNSGRTILVVEDNDINREILQSLLELEGYSVYQAENGLVGLELMEKHRDELSLIVLDIFMPVCDGHEFLRRKALDERYDTIPVIVATASEGEDAEIECLKLGANDFVTKPYKHDVMINRINNTIKFRESASIVNLLTWDDTTGLYSKSFFFQNVAQTFDANPDKEYSIVCSDIDNFKSLNERYGQEHCDKILTDLAKHLETLLPGYVLGGRIGGDVFAFLIEHQPKGWEKVLYRSTEIVTNLNLSVKFGIVEYVRRNIEVSTICDRALVAIERIKGPLGIDISWYDDALHEQQVLEQQILHNMETALAERQFVVQFQPKHNMRTDKTGGAEALVRWIHPEIGFISPGAFITIFERNGFITKLDMYVWEEACRQIKRNEELGLPLVPISVNASRLDFDMPDLAQQLAAIADEHNVDHSLLHVELTETAYSEDPDNVISKLRELRELGFLVELDDFGSGYSSLASLNTLPLDVMKLDMSLVRQAEKLNDFRIVESSIKLAQIMGLKIVIEGVETLEVAERLRDLGCDYIQGYYYSRPLKSFEFEEYLAEN